MNISQGILGGEEMVQKIEGLTIEINGLIDQLKVDDHDVSSVPLTPQSHQSVSAPSAARSDLYESSEQTNGCDDIWEVTFDDVFLKKGVYLVTSSGSPVIEDRKEPLWLLPSIQGMTFSDKRYKDLKLRGMPVGNNSPWYLHSEKSAWKQNYLHIFKTKRKMKLVPFTFHGSWWGSYPNYPPDLIDPEFSRMLDERRPPEEKLGVRDYSQVPVTKYELLKDIYHLYPPGPNSDKLDSKKWIQIFHELYHNRELSL